MRPLIVPRDRRPGAVVVAAGVVAALAGGCGSSVADQQVVDWVEPGWMAQFRQDMESFQLELVACYDEHGVTVTPSPSGGVDLPVVTLPAPPGLEELIDNAIAACMERVGVFHWLTLPLDEDAYQRMLESRLCLIAHGHEVSEAPPFEVWAEGHGEWNPHGVVYDGRPFPEPGPRWTASEWVRLNEQCPQPGPMVFGVSGLPN